MRYKRALSLLEILVALSVLSLALGAAAIPLGKMVRSETFHSGVEKLCTKLELAQQVMLDFQTDVEVRIRQEEGALVCTLNPRRPLPEALLAALNLHPKIKGIRSLSYEGQEGGVHLHYEGVTGAIPKGTLSLLGNREEEVIVLPGYPCRIKKGQICEKNAASAPYPEEILSLN